ncbi:hypothetical protein RAD16_26135 [Bradyrhizobium sp. 18BD]
MPAIVIQAAVARATLAHCMRQRSRVVQFSKDLIAVRNELRLRAEECFQECAGQSCVIATMFKVVDASRLIRDALFATQEVALGLL